MELLTNFEPKLCAFNGTFNKNDLSCSSFHRAIGIGGGARGGGGGRAAPIICTNMPPPKKKKKKKKIKKKIYVCPPNLYVCPPPPQSVIASYGPVPPNKGTSTGNCPKYLRLIDEQGL